MMDKLVYFDNAATTRIYSEVLKEMLPFFSVMYGNPSGIYEFSDKAKAAVEISKERISRLINAFPEEIYFTSGGTESDNWALKSIAFMKRNRGRHIITSKIEHPAVLNTCRYLSNIGYKVSYLDVDKYGMIDLNQLVEMIRRDTILISIMYANNEVGTVEPIERIGKIARLNGIVFHTDAVQAFGQIPIDVKKMNIDLLSASAHKLHGPKGCGCLYVNKDIGLPPIIHGGSQQNKMRAGTLNVPGIAGMGKAAQIAANNMDINIKKKIKMRDYIISEIRKEISDSILNGHETERLPGNINFSFKNVEGEALVILLDSMGICVSSASACSAGLKTPSHVLTAMGKNNEEAYESLRITLSSENTRAEIMYLLNCVKSAVENIRKMSY